MTTLRDLEAIEQIARQHGFGAHADLIADLIPKYQTDPGQFWSALNTNEVWGGSGSIADINLSAYSTLTEPQVKANEYAWRISLIRLYEAMVSRGQKNERAAFWVSTFRRWNEAGIGI